MTSSVFRIHVMWISGSSGEQSASIGPSSILSKARRLAVLRAGLGRLQRFWTQAAEAFHSHLAMRCAHQAFSGAARHTCCCPPRNPGGAGREAMGIAKP